MISRLNSIWLNETYSKVRKVNMSDNYPLRICPKQGDSLQPPLFDFAFEYAGRKFQESQVRLNLNRTHRLVSMLMT
jgi:hypothetical protein